MPDVSTRPAHGVVVIGRNEGDRLIGCLRSVKAAGLPSIYVDSGSHDGSAARAVEFVDVAHQLDPSRPFSAARARNEGFRRLLEFAPECAFVQFLDGDCVLSPGWLDAAVEAMRTDSRRAVVNGQLLERRPEASIYNLLCALEWRTAPGDLTDFGALGGIMLVRAEVFASFGGFREDVIAGEDSEFGVRVAAAGWRVTKLALPMATHDADMRRFSQWWARTVRGGHAIAQRAHLNGAATGDCVKERRSICLFGLLLPATIALTAVPTRGASLILLGAYGLLAWRVVRYRRSTGDSPREARIYAQFIVAGKLAAGVGLLRFYANRALGRYRIIEYK